LALPWPLRSLLSWHPCRIVSFSWPSKLGLKSPPTCASHALCSLRSLARSFAMPRMLCSWFCKVRSRSLSVTSLCSNSRPLRSNSRVFFWFSWTGHSSMCPTLWSSLPVHPHRFGHLTTSSAKRFTMVRFDSKSPVCTSMEQIGHVLRLVIATSMQVRQKVCWQAQNTGSS